MCTLQLSVRIENICQGGRSELYPSYDGKNAQFPRYWINMLS